MLYDMRFDVICVGTNTHMPLAASIIPKLTGLAREAKLSYVYMATQPQGGTVAGRNGIPTQHKRC